MGKDRNASSGLDGFKAGAFSAMTEIHSHAGRIHACDQAAAKGGQASIARFMTAIAGSIGLVVGQYGAPDRSEEHTSELQSLMRISYAVFCLKKKNNTSTIEHTTLIYNTSD